MNEDLDNLFDFARSVQSQRAEARYSRNGPLPKAPEPAQTPEITPSQLQPLASSAELPASALESSNLRIVSNASGSIRFVDCDDNEIVKLEWENGLITTQGDFDVRAGCDGVWSGIISPPA